MTLTFLGSGTSQGIPVVGCDCAVCRSADPKDRRMRASLLVKGGGAAVIDTGPEFRLQALRAGIKRLDAIFLTHAHADHLHGLDDVRPLTRERPLPVYCNHTTGKELRERFSYVFKHTRQDGSKPRIVLAETTGPVETGGMRFTPVPVKHGRLDILGWRIEETESAGTGPAAVYLTDVSAIPETSLPLIGSPEILIIGGLRMRPHETHFNFEQALTAAAQTGAKQVYLTHICHDYSHRQIVEYCNTFMRERGLTGISMEPARDGLALTLSG